MKKLIIIGMGAFSLLMSSCNDTTPKTDDCMHCTGCFSSWDECESSYNPAPGDSTSWEQHRDYMVNNPDGGTWVCTRNN